MDAATGAGSDSGTPSGGLTLAFVADPPLPWQSGDIMVTDLKISLTDIRAIGDSASGEGDTLRAFHVLEWEDDGTIAADDIAFPRAPPGIYSHLLADT